MADAVHYLCAVDDINMPPISETGCNGFPFLFNYSSPGTSNPIAVALEDSGAGYSNPSISRWYYRVRNWKLTTDFTVTDGNSPPNVYALVSGNLTPGPQNPTRELDTILSGGGSGSNARDFGFQISLNGDPPTVASGSGLAIMDLSGDTIDVDGGIFYPSLGLSINMDSVSISFDPAGSVTGEIDTLNIPINAINGNPGFDTFSGSQFMLEPVEYWAYAAMDGSAIWDTSSGAQLQDPRN